MKQSFQWLNKPMRSYLVLTLLFFGLLIAMPANTIVMDNYLIPGHGHRLLLFIIELPLIIWFAAFYGQARLSKYARSIRKTVEGRGFNQMAIGFKWLVWGLVVSALITLVLNGLAKHHPELYTAAYITSNYLYLLFPLIAFSLISDGAHNLAATMKTRAGSLSSRPMVLIYIFPAVIYCFQVFKHSSLQSLTTSLNPYYLPLWLLITTIIVPYLYTWFIGALAVYEMSRATRLVKGVLYRQSLQLVAIGTGLVIFSSVGVQYLHSITAQGTQLQLSIVLSVVYSMYALLVGGFILISLGAHRLNRIEDI